MFVCSSFLISVCMFIVWKALLTLSATVIVRTGGTIWLNPYATVLFTVCSTVTVEYCVCSRVAWVCLVCFLLYKEECSSPVALQLLRRGCMRCPCPCLCWVFGFWMGTMLANFHMCGMLMLMLANVCSATSNW